MALRPHLVGGADGGPDPVTMVEKFPDDVRSDEPGGSGHNHGRSVTDIGQT